MTARGLDYTPSGPRPSNGTGWGGANLSDPAHKTGPVRAAAAFRTRPALDAGGAGGARAGAGSHTHREAAAGPL